MMTKLKVFPHSLYFDNVRAVYLDVYANMYGALVPF